jgi:hypothetical protein
VRRLEFKRVSSANPNHSFIRTDHLHEHASTYDTRAHGEHTRETQQRLRYTVPLESPIRRVCCSASRRSASFDRRRRRVSSHPNRRCSRCRDISTSHTSHSTSMTRRRRPTVQIHTQRVWRRSVTPHSIDSSARLQCQPLRAASLRLSSSIRCRRGAMPRDATSNVTVVSQCTLMSPSNRALLAEIKAGLAAELDG